MDIIHLLKATVCDDSLCNDFQYGDDLTLNEDEVNCPDCIKLMKAKKHYLYRSSLDKYNDEAYCGNDLDEFNTLVISLEEVTCEDCKEMLIN